LWSKEEVTAVLKQDKQAHQGEVSLGLEGVLSLGIHHLNILKEEKNSW